jgi:putative flippase GtrA
VNLAILYLGVELFSLHYLNAKVLAVGLSFLLNYAGQSRITFQNA